MLNLLFPADLKLQEVRQHVSAFVADFRTLDEEEIEQALDPQPEIEHQPIVSSSARFLTELASLACSVLNFPLLLQGEHCSADLEEDSVVELSHIYNHRLGKHRNCIAPFLNTLA